MSTQATPTLSLKGIGASPGVAVGRAFLLDRRRARTPKLRLGDEEIHAELMRLKTALELSEHQLNDLKTKVAADGHDHELIIEAHRLMLHDPMLVDEVQKLIERDRINAEWAVRRVSRKIKHMFDNIPDEYFRERRQDVDYVADRVVRNLMGQVVDDDVDIPDGAVVVAHDLSPGDTALLVKSGKAAGFVTETVFNIPGVARFLVEAIRWRDYPIVQNLVMFIAVVAVSINFLIDLLYGVLDPRIRYGR